jgi:Transglycosylase-like domain
MALLVAGMLLLGALAQSEDVVALAAQHGIDNPLDLQAASDTVGVTPAVYVRTTSPHAPPPPPTPPASGLWDRLANCESSGNWHINSYFDGGLQFLPSTWTANKPAGYPAFAYQASREQQIHVAQIVQARYGWGQWPACSRRLGLR